MKNKDLFDLALIIQKEGELELQRTTEDAFLLLPIFEEVIVEAEKIQQYIITQRSLGKIKEGSQEDLSIRRKIMEDEYVPLNKVEIDKLKKISVRLLYALKGFY